MRNLQFLQPLLTISLLLHPVVTQHFVTQTIPIHPSRSTSLSSTTDRTQQFIAKRVLKIPTTIFQENCRQPLRTSIDWSTQVESSAYSTPVIRQSRSSGDTIVASTYIHFIESLSANTGRVSTGWPLEFQENEFPSSPVLHDVDHDGNKEILVVNKVGQLVVVHVDEDGRFLRNDVIYPFKLRYAIEKEIDRDEMAGTKSSRIWEWVTRVLHLDQQNRTSKKASTGKESNTILGPGHRIVDPRKKNNNNKKNSKRKFKIKQQEEEEEEEEEDWQRRNSWNELVEAQHLDSNEEQKEKLENGKGWTTLTGHVLASPTLYNGKLYIVTSFFVDEDVSSTTTPASSLSTSAIAVSCWTLGVYCDSNAEVGCVPSTYPSQKWSTIVETSISTRLKAYSSPSVADINGDGNVDVIIGTSTGLIHVLDSERGTLIEGRSGFSTHRYGEIQGDLLIEDLGTSFTKAPSNSLNIVSVDMSGNIICFNSDGSISWHANVKGAISSGASAIRFKREVHVFVVTSLGDLWGFQGSDGQLLNGYPIKLTSQRLMTSVTPMTVRRSQSVTLKSAEEVLNSKKKEEDQQTEEELHLIVPSMDGKIYIVRVDEQEQEKQQQQQQQQQQTMCKSAVIDVGEHMYADVLVRGTIPNDHVHFHHRDGRQKGLLTSFVVSTMHGNILSIVVDDSTYMSRDQWFGGNGPHRRVGLDVGDGAIALLDEDGSSGGGGNGGGGGGGGASSRLKEENTRHIHIVVGHTFQIRFQLHASRKRRRGPYNVVVRHGSIVVGRATYTQSGVKSMELSLNSPGIYILDITSMNAHQLTYTATFVVDYNTQLASSVLNMLTVPMVVFTMLFVAFTSSFSSE
jgi:hypothetical protein